MTLRRAQNSLRICQRKKFKKARRKLNTLMNEFEKYMNGNWILNMSITSSQTQRITPGETTSRSMGLRKKTEKVGRIEKLKEKNFQEKNQTLKTKLSQKVPQSKKSKKQEKNHPRTIMCYLLSYEDKQNDLKNCKKLKGTNIFVNEDFSQESLEHRRELWKEVRRLREEEDKISYLNYCSIAVRSKNIES